ncbi:hypothetical protein SLS58_007916 [Diplodia intermedia]|uniref:Uncharacterized protein n=1 Tax=Diplodia intermedia TaxID=856260 RepID=A0ABR3TJ95_9PEZI
MTGVKTSHTTTSTAFGQTRSYASLSDTVSMGLAEAYRSVTDPQILAGCRKVHLTLANADWPKWDPDAKPHRPSCHSKLSHILGALDSSQHIDCVFLALSDVLALPLVHHALPNKQERTPVTVFNTIAVHVEPIDLGLWHLPDYQSTFIRDPVTTRLLCEARTFQRNAVAWQRVIAKAGPAYQAYDYTASFHSADLCIESDTALAIMRSVDFGPYSSKPCTTSDLDGLSTRFADDLAHNTRYFELGNRWRPGLFDSTKRGNGGAVTSKLARKP